MTDQHKAEIAQQMGEARAATLALFDLAREEDYTAAPRGFAPDLAPRARSAFSSRTAGENRRRERADERYERIFARSRRRDEQSRTAIASEMESSSRACARSALGVSNGWV